MTAPHFWEQPFALNQHLTLKEAWDAAAQALAVQLEDRRSEQALEAAEGWMMDAVDTLRFEGLSEEQAVQNFLYAWETSTSHAREFTLFSLRRLDRMNGAVSIEDILAAPYDRNPDFTLGDVWERAVSRLAGHLSCDARTQKDATLAARQWLQHAVSAMMKYNPGMRKARAVANVADSYLNSKEIDWTMSLTALLRLDAEKGRKIDERLNRPMAPGSNAIN